jgi:hypothetical protein
MRHASRAVTMRCVLYFPSRAWKMDGGGRGGAGLDLSTPLDSTALLNAELESKEHKRNCVQLEGYQVV